jgi:HK97 family phage portal protein
MPDVAHFGVVAKRSLVRSRPPAQSLALMGGTGGLPIGFSPGTTAGLGPTGEVTLPSPPVAAGDALGLPAFNRGKNLIGGLVSQMTLVDRKDDGTAWPLNPMLDEPWSVIMSYPEWISYQIDAMLMTGDAMAVPADFDADGYPRQLVPLDPRAVRVRLGEGTVLYDIYTTEGIITLSRSQIFHAKGLTLTSDGLRGVGVLTQFMLALGMGQALMRYGVNAFHSGVPTGVIKINMRQIKPETAAQAKADWMQMFADRSPAVLTQLMDFTPISWSPLDAQFLENRKFNIADIAFILNLDPTDLDATAGSVNTYANREQRAFDRLLTSIGPYLSRFERAFRMFTPRGHYPTFDRSVILWPDASTRATVQQVQLATGVMTLNEGRAQEQRPLFGPWADEPWAQPPGPVPPDTETNPQGGSDSSAAPGEVVSTDTPPDQPPPPSSNGSSSNGGVGATVNIPAHSRRPPVRSGGRNG